jgi:DNA ligase-1
MKRFAALYRQLDESRGTGAKVEALRRYFTEADDVDAAWGLYFLSGRRLKRLVPPTRLRQWAAEIGGQPDWMIAACHAHVGDLAETVALLLDGRSDHAEADVPLAQWVARLRALEGLDEADARARLATWWQHLPTEQCFLLNKLLTGALRVGVSAGLAQRALAEALSLDPALVAQRLMGDWQPGAGLIAGLRAPPAEGTVASRPYPFCLAAPVGDDAPALGRCDDYLAEWKWDGIRAQLIRREGQVFLWSRGEELLEGRFPDIEAAAMALPDGQVLDGEIVAWREGVRPFAELQRRINKRKPGMRLLREVPVVYLAYDLLEAEGHDLREAPLRERRARLEALLQDQAGIRLSPPISAADWPSLAALRADARGRGVEGLMLKAWDQPYRHGRRRGVWWKWKVDPMTVDAVLIYAQAGRGRRANLYTDYTLAVWQGETLVPVAKAYSGLSDRELTDMDRWIRRNTTERFGPVRSVLPEQVFEIAFEGIQPSSRHKAGLALRFPRIHRWRQDKPAAEADTLDTLRDLLDLRSAQGIEEGH